MSDSNFLLSNHKNEAIQDGVQKPPQKHFNDVLLGTFGPCDAPAGIENFKQRTNPVLWFRATLKKVSHQ